MTSLLTGQGGEHHHQNPYAIQTVERALTNQPHRQRTWIMSLFSFSSSENSDESASSSEGLDEASSSSDVSHSIGNTRTSKRLPHKKSTNDRRQSRRVDYESNSRSRRRKLSSDSDSDGSNLHRKWPRKGSGWGRAPYQSRSLESREEWQRFAHSARRRSPLLRDSPKAPCPRGTPRRRARESEAPYRPGSLPRTYYNDHQWLPRHSFHSNGPTPPIALHPEHGSYSYNNQWSTGQNSHPDEPTHPMDPRSGHDFQPYGHPPGYATIYDYDESIQSNLAPNRPGFTTFCGNPDFNAQNSTPLRQRPMVNGQNWMQIKPVQRHDTSETARLCGSGKRSRFSISLRSRTVSTVDEEMGLGYSRPGVQEPATHSPEASFSCSLLEILQTRWIPTDDGAEDVTLTLKDTLNEVEGNITSSLMRWL